MPPDLWALVLLVTTLGWFALSLLPALHEHIKRTDIEPLRIPGEARSVRHFAASFRRQLDDRIGALNGDAPAEPAIVGRLDDGTALWYAPPAASAMTLFVPSLESPHAAERETADVAVLCRSGLRVPEMARPLKEVYVAGNLEAGSAAGNVYRALLVDGSAVLGRDSVVLRWIDVGRDLRVGAGSTLWGRASAGDAIALDSGVRFQRLAAPRIVFGRDVAVPAPRPAPRTDWPADAAIEPPATAHVAAGRWLIDGDFTIPPARQVDSAIVVSGRLRVGRASMITGAVKATHIEADEQCVFDASLVATEQITLGNACIVAGPIVAEGAVSIGDYCRLGTEREPTTITALEVRMGHGCLACGEVWARHIGTTRTSDEETTSTESRGESSEGPHQP